MEQQKVYQIKKLPSHFHLCYFCLVYYSQYLLRILFRYNDTRYKARESECEYIPEPACYILIGFTLSCIIHLTDKMSVLSKMMEKYLVFESDIFFYVLLPIIIFDSGYIISNKNK